jgi:hypothetical protein
MCERISLSLLSFHCWILGNFDPVFFTARFRFGIFRTPFDSARSTTRRTRHVWLLWILTKKEIFEASMISTFTGALAAIAAMERTIMDRAFNPIENVDIIIHAVSSADR